MSHIFFSYAREDRPRAELLADALQREGWSVWWDRAIPAGRAFDDVIEEALDAASCVVVLWSEQSVNNRWVRSEADEGAVRGALVPVLIEQVRIPLAFRRIQAADLVAWNGDRRDPNYLQLLADIAALLKRPPGERVTATRTPAAQRPPEDRVREAVADPQVRSADWAGADAEPRTRAAGPALRTARRADDGVAVQTSASAPTSRFLQGALTAQMVATAIGCLGTPVPEIIVTMMAVMGAIGVLLIALGLWYRSPSVSLLGLWGPAIGLLARDLVYRFSWDRTEGHGPLVTIMLVGGIPYAFLLRQLVQRLRSPSTS